MGTSHSKIIVLVLFITVFSLAVNFCFTGQAAAAPLNLKDAFKVPLDTAAGSAGAGYNKTATAESIISLIISTVLSFFGVIFLILAIYGGYIWMIARGNEQEVDKAKNIIQGAVIGLIIVFAAYAISWYVINILGNKTLQQQTTPPPASGAIST